MDYGDELNDDEENQYKKEYKAKNQEEEGDEGEEGESEMSESSEEIIEPKVLPQRTTRGKRMNALVG